MKKIQLLTLAASLSCSLTLTSCLDEYDNPTTPTTPTTPTNINEDSEFSSMIDASTYAGDDFYQYAVGTWLAPNPVPTKDGDEARFL